jgi:hypothetical protein
MTNRERSRPILKLPRSPTRTWADIGFLVTVLVVLLSGASPWWIAAAVAVVTVVNFNSKP